MRVEAEREVGGTPLLQSEPRQKPCRARSEGEPRLARRCVVLGVSDNRINPSPGGSDSDSDFPPTVRKSRRKLVKPGKALVLALSKSSARRGQFLWQQCVPFCAIDCLESDLFLCQCTSLFRPSLDSSNTTWGRLG